MSFSAALKEARRHSPWECERELEAHHSYDPFRCSPLRWTCSCRAVWVHVCDEAEGCFYEREEG